MNAMPEADNSFFVLDEGCDATLIEVMPLDVRWTEFPHACDRERGLVMLAGEVLHIGARRVPREPVLWMRCLRGLPQISCDGLDVEIWSWNTDGEGQRLLSLRLENEQPDASLHVVEVSLPLIPGSSVRFELRCGAGPRGQPEADWLGITGLVICARDSLPLQRARIQNAWRLANEIQHFNQVYSGDFYRDRQQEWRAAATGAVRELPSCEGYQENSEALRIRLLARLRHVAPTQTENAFTYAHRLLAELLPLQPPDFPSRLRSMAVRCKGRPLRMLSLCAGEAAVEGSILQAAGVPVDLCIVDVNKQLLERASLRMPPQVSVDRVLGDANGIGRQLGQFDIVNITSGLHHLVELEKVLSAIAAILRPTGEFWLIGEQVGCNGNRLWPEAWAVANGIFADWPSEKRFNHNSGQVDDCLPDLDFSSACFEGIRSQDILDQLARRFLPVDCYQRDAFLWRLVDVAYASNFDLAVEQDVVMLCKAVVEEAILWSEAGRGTELHAVYRSKFAALREDAGEEP